MLKQFSNLSMKHSDNQPESEAIVVVLNKLGHRVDVITVAQPFELCNENVVIDLEQVVEMLFPEMRGRARTEEVVEVDRGPTHFYKLEVNEFDLVTSEMNCSAIEHTSRGS